MWRLQDTGCRVQGASCTLHLVSILSTFRGVKLNFACNLNSYNVVLISRMSTGLSDTEIISRVLQGEKNAFAELVTRYQNYVFTLTLRFTKNREDAEEISQDIFVKAYRSLADFRGASKFSTWLYTIVNTTCITFLRKKKLDIKSLDDERTFEVADNQDSDFRANTVEQKSKLNMVNRAIAMLNPDDAEIITLFYKGEQSLEEIGTILGLETNTAKVRLHRARLRLKEKMEKHFAEEVRDL
jgi:RNA polymerase sigma-70 factor (ECF subfamily)